MFNFNFGLMQIDGLGDSASLANLEKEIAALASVATAAAVNSPAVVESPKNTAPSTAAVQTVVNQVVQAVAPVVAPTVPNTVISKLEPIIADSVASNPKVIASPAGATVPVSATNAIASTISNTFKTDAQKDAELAAAIKTVATTTTTAQPAAVTQPTTTAQPVTTAPVTAAANVQAQNFTGRGISNDPLKVNGTAFTGNRNGIEYKNGVAVNASRADILEADRLATEAAEAEKRAASNPLFNPTVRPVAPPPDKTIQGENIYYYGWVGGVSSGQWKLYSQPSTGPADKVELARIRSEGGVTQATFSSAVGANQLKFGGSYTPGVGFTNPETAPGGITGGATSGVTSGATSGVTSGVTSGITSGVTSGVTGGGVTGGGVTGGVTGGTTGGLTGGLTGGITSGVTSGTTTGALVTTPTTTATTATPVIDINRQSAIKSLQDRFAKYGLSSLANKILELAQDGATEATITLQLQETPEYQMRFRANQERLKKGLTVLTPAEYLNLEDGYRQILRAYGLRQFDNDDYVQQFISNDVSPAELSNRVVTAVQRVQNADPEISRTLRDFYGIGQNDLVAYVLDPEQQFQRIERQVAAAEIGTAARLQGIEAGVGTAEALAAQGITQAEARRGYSTIADILPTAEKLSEIYGGVEKGYGLAEAEQEVFNSLAEAQRRRQRLASREAAQFSGTSGVSRVGLTQQQRGQFQNP